MAGVKGKSGGARPGTGGARPNSGGVRSGAGRKKKSAPNAAAVAAPITEEPKDMLALLQDVALGRIEATQIQVRAAIAAVQYTHVKKGDGGKKDELADKAKRAGSGKFAPATAPKLVINNR